MQENSAFQKITGAQIITNNSSEINRRKSSHKVAYLYDSNKNASSVSSKLAEIMIAVEIFENEVIHPHIKALIWDEIHKSSPTNYRFMECYTQMVDISQPDLPISALNCPSAAPERISLFPRSDNSLLLLFPLPNCKSWLKKRCNIKKKQWLPLQAIWKIQILSNKWNVAWFARLICGRIKSIVVIFNAYWYQQWWERIIPWVAILYLMLSLDRNNIGNARLGTLEEDLHLSGNDYYTALTIFFAGKLQRQIMMQD